MTITKEGALASFYTVNKAPIKHLKVYFSPKQVGEGDPSPENVREISGWNGLQVHTAGKNLIRFPVMTRTITGITWITHADGSIDVNGTSENQYTFMSKWTVENEHLDFYLKAGTYRLSGNNPKIASIYLVARDGSTNANIGSVGPSQTSSTFTLAQDTLVGFQVAVASNAGEIHVTFQPQLELINVTEYEKPHYNSYNLDWNNNIGTVYGGYVDLITGELIQTQKLYTFTGTESGAIINWESYTVSLPDAINSNSVTVAKCCSHAPCSYGSLMWSSASAQNGGHDVLCTISQTPFARFRNRNLSDQTVSGYQTYLQGQYNNGTPVQVVYTLATPITYQLTPQQLQTFIGQNNIWSNADRVEVEYDLAESNDELYRRRNIILQEAPHIESISNEIANFQTDMIAPLKETKIYFNSVQEGGGDPSPENVRLINGWSELKLHQTQKSLINLSDLNFTDNTANINLSVINNTLSFSQKKVGNNFVNSAQTVDWIIPPALKGKEVYIGCTSVNLQTSNENHRSTVVCQFNDKDDKRITDPTVVSYLPNTSDNTLARKVTIPENAVVAKLFFRIAQNIGTYNTAIGDSVTFNDFHITYPTGIYQYEEYNGNIIPITFPAIGKNLLNAGTITFTTHKAIEINPPLPSGTYTLSALITTNDTDDITNCIGLNTNGAGTIYLALGRDVRKSQTFTSTKEIYKINFYAANTYTTSIGDNVTYTNIQLESGSTATSYEPYTNTVYGGYVDLVSRKLIQTHKKIDLGDFNWSYYVYANCSGGYTFGITDSEVYGGNTIPNAYCSALPITTDNDFNNDSSTNASLTININNMVKVKIPNVTDPASLKSALSGIKLVYQLKTPIEYPLTTQTLKTLKGTNNIWSNANGPVEISYWTH